MIIDRERFKLVKRKEKLWERFHVLCEQHRELRKQLKLNDRKTTKVYRTIMEIQEQLGETNG